MAAPIRRLPLRPPLAPPPGIPLSSLKVSAPIVGDFLPRIVASGAQDTDFVELRLQIPGPPGRPGELLTARIPAKTYLKHQAAVEKFDGACTALVQGRIVASRRTGRGGAADPAHCETKHPAVGQTNKL